MHTIAVWNRKGGAGKTTLTSSIGVAAHEAGYRTVLVDIDSQKSLATWGRFRSADEPFVATADSATVTAVLDAARKDRRDLVFIDMPGVLGPDEARVLKLANLVVVPARPSPLDVAATLESIDIIRKVAKGRSVVVLTQVRPVGAEIAEMRVALADVATVIEPTLGIRVAYPHAIAAGLGPTESEPLSPAADEVRAVLAAILEGLSVR